MLAERFVRGINRIPMSAHRRRVISSPRAELDHEDIVVSGEQRWGEEQAVAYSYLIDAAVVRLGSFPEIGNPRDDVFPGCRSVPVGQHIVYYRIMGETVRIVRILHRRMNPHAHVTGNE